MPSPRQIPFHASLWPSAAAGRFVSYVPLADEVDPTSIPESAGNTKDVFHVPKEADADPHSVARNLAQRLDGASTFLLIPGRAFDASGTRKGRGAGWIDRFLAHAPAEWIRVGICDETQLRDELHPNSWDEPMDWILIRRPDGWNAIETGARHPLQKVRRTGH